MAKQLQYLNFKIKEVCKSFFLLFHIDWKFDLWLSFNVCVTIIQDAKYDRVFHMIRPIKYDFFLILKYYIQALLYGKCPW